MLLKIFKGAFDVFSIGDSVTHPYFDGHLLSVGKDTEFSINVPNF